MTAATPEPVVRETTQIPMHELVQAAIAVAANAYARYSGFQVGAALLLSNREVVTGTNVENSSFGLTICAERSAMVRAVALYGPQIRVKAVAIVNLNHAASPPCGACRQVLSEFMDGSAPVSFPVREGSKIRQVVHTFGELLPHTFEFQPK